uniref:5-amino-6-(D-ribitylamino)uracil--L-tyrosine 4-hydroxyphenyl transferase n=1 Tax=Candidatus Methanophagaceae archaeon ANME-1 ERB6 TaxID=2759912 RepID=A0A7G9Z052_9EURY|nr:5-amino-6-(D-ribitylamino)uracil--L-tyrosine 4-hydroxyphenyl transferase [Methanosarcinales archaeon ANME-1 ERB6]
MDEWTPERIEELFKRDTHELGQFADYINRANGNIVTFVVNRHINYTNICVSKCPLCAFYRDVADSDAYFMSIVEVLEKVAAAVKIGATELHIVGSLNPEMGIEYFEQIFGQIKRRYPHVIIKALTATEIYFIAQVEGTSVEEVLSRLRDAGLQAMPGGGAEILANEIREVICPNKIKADEWLRIMAIAHSLGIKSNATMLFGHIEKPEHRAVHLYKLWKLQEQTGGFVSFIPLLFYPENTELNALGLVEEKTDPMDILKTIAVSRIVLRNFDSIRAYWVALGEKLAQVALNYGANDLDGTLMEERITHAAGAKTPLMLSINKVLSIVNGANKIPAERDTFYNILKVYS